MEGARPFTAKFAKVSLRLRKDPPQKLAMSAKKIYWLVSQIGFRPTGTVLFVIGFTVPAMSVYLVYCAGTFTFTVVQTPLEHDFEVSQIAWPTKPPVPV